MAPYPKITTYPPLGQFTIIPPTQEIIYFTLIIEWNLVCPPYLFDFSLAYAAANTTQHESTWKTISLVRSTTWGPHILDAENCQRAIYAGTLSRQDILAQLEQQSGSSRYHHLFTVRYRVDAHAHWQWVSVVDGTKPGELILQQSLTTSADTTSLLHTHADVNPDWTITALPPPPQPNPSTQAFLLESKSPIEKNTDPSALSVLPLASLPTCTRYFSIIRLEPYWLGPRQGKGPFFHTSEDAIVCCFLLDTGVILVFIVLGWVDDVYQVFQSDDRGRIVVAGLNDSGADERYRVAVGVGTDFEGVMEAAVDQVRAVVSSSAKIARFGDAVCDVLGSVDLDAAAESAGKWMDSLAFCTWNALGQDLTQEKILSALEQLEKNGIRISTLLIDDNWQTLGETKYDYKDSFCRGWADMEANTSVAPSGLKDLITDIRTKHPAIKDVGVWHALMGYWGGISPSGSIARQYPTIDIDTFLMGNKPASVTTIAPQALHQFYDDFYSFLRSSGVTFVKTDVQHMLSMYQTSQTRQDLISTYQSAWTCAHLKHFAGKAISCMSQIPQTLFHSLMQTTTPAIVHRNSDDFYPEIPASHPWHIWVNAHNALFTRHLNVVLDWDMFQTDHEFSAYHAAARCLSGGPIVITDVPGQHDVDLIDQMTATAPSGHAIALRPCAGTTVQPFNSYTEGGVLKVRARVQLGGVVVGLFNISEKEVRAALHVSEFDLEPGVTAVLVRSHRTGELFGPVELSVSSEAIRRGCGLDLHGSEAEMTKLVHTRLATRGWEILNAHAVTGVSTSSGRLYRFSVLGLLGKMSGGAAITGLSVNLEVGQWSIQVSLKALGRLGIWFDRLNAKAKVEMYVQGSRIEAKFVKLVTLPGRWGRGGSGVVRDEAGVVASADSVVNVPHVREVDVEAFWKQAQMWDEKCQEIVVDIVVGQRAC